MSNSNMTARFRHPELPFEEPSPDPPKKKAPASTVNADAGSNQLHDGKLHSSNRQIKTKASEETRTNPKHQSQEPMDEFDFSVEKSPLSGTVDEKASSVAGEKAPSVGDGKTPSDYLPRMLLGLVDEAGLKNLLCRNKQHEWCSRKRIAGLLMIIDFFARNGPGTAKKPGTAMSSALSREYVSTLKRAKNASTIRQPLMLLVEIGILEVAQKAVVAPHRKTSARYRIHPRHGGLKKIEAMLTTQQRNKLQSAGKRNEKRLNRKHPFRKQLLADLATVGLSDGGRNLALTMMTNGEKESSIKGLMAIINGTKLRGISIDPCGTIHCFARLAPRELKPHMTLGGEPVAICDIESAHICVLSCVLQERIDWMVGHGKKTVNLEQERRSLIAILESADIYEYLDESGDRNGFKKSLLSSINMPTSKAVHVVAYQRFRGAFPLTATIIEDIKKKGHHGISRPLQHHTARIIQIAMGDVQKIGVACIPDTDALIIPIGAETTVMEIINHALFQVTGIARRRG
jgi:hypothetical protein